MSAFNREILSPAECKKIAPHSSIPIWTYRYTHPTKKFTLAIATGGAPGSESLSLGGFRIAPKDRMLREGFSAEREAIELANGMDEKVFWSRITEVAGPLGIKELKRIVGGKCVMAPADGARVGESDDFALLDFGTACLNDFEAHAKVYLTTGQDLGHGIMSDGKTSSLKYLHEKFMGSVLEDTSKPTGEGNFYCLKGMIEGFGLTLSKSKIGLIGCGNVGEHLMRKLIESGAEVFVVENAPAKLKMLQELGIKVFEPKDKMKLMELPLDAICVNASGGSLDDATIFAISKNPTIKIVCGSENLAMPNPDGARTLLVSKKLLCPMELCGMMGYLTAVEEYCSTRAKVPFNLSSLFEAAKKLEAIGFSGTSLAIKKGFSILFEDAVKEVYGAQQNAPSHYSLSASRVG